MGYFTNQSVISSNSFYSPILEEFQDRANPHLLSAVVRGSSITNAVLLEALGNISAKAENFYEYGVDAFANGIPEGTNFFAQNSVDPSTIEGILETETGADVIVQSVLVRTPIADLFARELMQDTQGWNSETNRFTNPPDLGADNGQNGEEYISAELGGIFPKYSLYITYSAYDDDSTDLDRFTKTLTFTLPKSFTPAYYHVTYYRDGDFNRPYYWVYDPTSGVYTELPVPTQEPLTTYYPIVPVKANGVYTIDLDEDDELRITSKRAMNLLGMRLGDVTDTVSENPDEDKIDDALITFAANLNTENQVTLKYLVKYFKDLSTKSAVTRTQYEAWLSTVNDVPRNNPYNSIEIQDENFYMEMVYNYIDIKTKTGNVGAIGEIQKEFDLNAPKFEQEAAGSDNEGDYIYYTDRNILYLRTQLDSDTYEEIEVHGLLHIARLYGLEEDLTVKTTTLRHIEEDGEGGFFIPLDRSVVVTLSKDERIEVLTNTLAFLITASQKQWLSWYQTAFGKAIIFIAAAIIFYYSWDTTGFIALVEAYGYFYAILITLAYLVVKYAISNYLVRKIVQEIGEENTGILYAILLVASVYFGDPSQGQTWLASSLLEFTNVLGVGLGAYQRDEMDAIRGELENLLEEQQEIEEELERARDLLGTSSVDPFTIIEAVAYNNPNESPEQFIYRTSHLTNPGVLSLDYATNYHDLALTLPEPPTIDFTV